MFLRLDDEDAVPVGHRTAVNAVDTAPTRSGVSALSSALLPLVVVLAYATLVWTAPPVLGHEVRWITIGHVGRSGIAALTAAALVFAIHLLVKASRGGPLEPPSAIVAGFLARRWREDRLLSVLTPPLFLAVLMSAFTTFKQRVLPQAGFGMDPLLAEVDRMLLFGFDAWQLTLGVFGSALVTQLIDWAYMIWFVPMTVLPLLSWLMPPELRTRTLLTYAFCWILIGSVAAYLLPSAGPVYYEQFHGAHASFAEMNRTLARLDTAIVAGGGNGLLALDGQAGLLMTYHSTEFRMAAGISAMPSLHNAMAVLFALVAFRVHRAAGLAFAAFAILIFVGSVHLGWHYAVDGVVACALTIAVWRMSGAIARRLGVNT